MIRLRNLVIFEVVSILLLCTVIGALLFMSGLSSFWRERYSRDSGIIRQAFLDHRNEILNGNTRGFESTLASIANLYGIRALEVNYNVTGKVVQITRDLTNRIDPRLTSRVCRRPDARTISTGPDVCFFMDFPWTSEAGSPAILSMRWWVLPDGLAQQKQTALLVFCVVLLLGILFCALHWVLIQRVIVRPIAVAVSRFEGWVRQEGRVPPLENGGKRSKTKELNELIQHFDQLMTVAEDYRNMRDLTIQLEAVELIARQVTHDLRSPLGALRMAVDRLSQSPSAEARALAMQAFKRTNEILATLGQHGSRLPIRRPGDVMPAMRVENVFFLLEPVVAEHSLQVDPAKIEIRLFCEEGLEVFACVDPVNIRRAISNLLNNAIEALPASGGKIAVGLRRDGKHAEITINDTGAGMPKHVLERLGQKGLSFGKDTMEGCGSGLGVYQAMHAVDESSGQLEFQSQEGFGTTVMIRLPAVSAPGYWCQEIPLAPRVVVVDDEITTHRMWRERFEALPCDLVTFLSGTEFEDWYATAKDDGVATVFLLDFSLGQHQPTGFELITRNDIPPARVVIVTGMAENTDLQIQAERTGTQLMHKRYIPTKAIMSSLAAERDDRAAGDRDLS